MQPNRLLYALLTGLGLALVLILVALSSAQAPTVHADPGDLFVAPDGSGDACTQAEPCSLPTALAQTAAGDIIYIAQGVYTGTGAAVVDISADLSLYGSWDGAPTGPVVRDPALYTTTLDAEYGRRVVNVGGAVLEATLDGLHLVRGNASGLGRQGGGLYANMASVRLVNCTFRHNVAYTATLAAADAYGGAVYFLNPNAATVISNCHFLDNTAARAPNTPGYGGAVYVGGAIVGGHVSLVGNTLERNLASTNGQGNGGALALSSGQRSYTLEANVISHNTGSQAISGQGLGGGVYLSYAGPTTLTHNILWHNVANENGEGYGGGLFAANSTVLLVGNAFEQNQGGWDSGGGGGLRANTSHLALEANLFRFNAASFNDIGMGGGLWLESGVYTLTNNVVAGNAASIHGAGVWLDNSRLVLRHNTLANNNGEGLAVGNHATATLTNTIAAGNTTAFRLVGATACTITAETTLFWNNPTDLTGTHPLVGDPAFVGGGDYHLTAGSAAVDVGVDAGVPTDMDGGPRPTGPAPDIGADELPPVYGVQLAPPRSGLAPAGGTITYTHRLTNTGNAADLYTLVAHIAAAGWSVQVSPHDVGPLPAGAAVGVVLTVTAPLTAAPYTHGTAYLTTTSQGDPAVWAVVSDTTGVECTAVVSVGLGYIPAEPLAGQPVTFSATPDPPAASLPLTYTWAFGDGDTAQGVQVSHTYAASHTYTVWLTADNPCGQVIVSRVIFVGAALPALHHVYLPLVVRNR